jgi:hypothetical protein
MGEHISLLGRLSLQKKDDVYPLSNELSDLIKFLFYYREEIKPVDPVEFLSLFVFEGRYIVDDVMALERHYRLAIPGDKKDTITKLHRDFFQMLLPFSHVRIGSVAYRKTRGMFVEKLALLVLKLEEGKEGHSSVILLEDGKSFGIKYHFGHEELDIVKIPEGNEMAIGECKTDGSRFHEQEGLLQWYETAAERVEQEGINKVHMLAVCAENDDIMTKHIGRMRLKRPWWGFTVIKKKEAWKI